MIKGKVLTSDPLFRIFQDDSQKGQSPFIGVQSQRDINTEIQNILEVLECADLANTGKPKELSISAQREEIL